MGSPIDRTAKAAMDLNLVNGVTSDAPKLKNSDNVLYDYVDGLNAAQDAHALATTLAHPDGSVKTAKIADGAVTTAKLADQAVTSAKIANQAVGVAQLSPGAQVNESVNNALIVALQADIATVKRYGATGDGVSDDSISFTNALASNNTIYLPPGTYIVNELTLPNKDVFIYGNGATIKSTSGSFIFKRRKRGYLTKIYGVDFIGNSTAFDYDSDDVSLPYATQLYEYEISKCRFLQAGSVKAVRLYGSREGLIDSCYFDGNDGIYTEFSINSVVSNCQFKNCNYGVLSKLGSEGLIYSNGVALGCSFGIRCERTTGVQIINSMIDYCDSPIYLQGATDVLIQNSYISTRTAAPAIHSVKYPDGFRGSNHVIKGNNIRDNYSLTGSACVRYEETDFFLISGNVLENYASYGIVYTLCTQADIAQNMIRNRSASGTNSILSLTDDSTVRIYDNRLMQVLIRTYYNSTYRNAGFKTENRNEAIITAGNSAVTVNHDLAITPNKLDITLTPTTPNTKDMNYYVSATTATTLTITTDTVVSGTTAFAWTHDTH